MRVERFRPTERSVREVVLVVDAAPERVDYRALLRSARCVVLLAVDGVRASDGMLHRLGLALLDAGAVYFVSAGAGAGRVDAVMDDVILFGEDGATRVSTESSVILTVSEPDLDEALWFALTLAYPAEDFEDGCDTLLVVCDDEHRADAFALALADVDAFVARWDG